MENENTPIMDVASKLVETSGLNITPRGAVQQILQSEALLVLDEVGTLDSVVFQGGSSIYRCYDGIRLSEDLDFRMTNEVLASEMKQVARTIRSRVADHLGVDPEIKMRGFDDIDPMKTSCLTIKTLVSTNKAVPKVMTKLDFDALPVYEPILKTSHSLLDVMRGLSMPVVMAKTAEELVADKITSAALTGLSHRRNPRSRDAFDICWLFDNQQIDLQAVGKMARAKVCEYGREEDDLPTGIEAFCASVSYDDYAPITNLAPMLWDDTVYEQLTEPRTAQELMRKFVGICAVALNEPSLRAALVSTRPHRGI